MKRHITRMHTVHTKEICLNCGKLVLSHYLSTHLKRHLKQYTCSDCGKGFSTKSDLSIHLNYRHTEEKVKKKEECPVCKKMLSSKPSLHQHLKIHIGKRGHKCPKCSETFITEHGLIKHVKAVHRTGEQLKCEHCDKVFYLRYMLVRHMRNHTGEEPYKCKICDKRFTNSRNCTTHVRKHTGEKPYCCHQCKKMFSKRHYLTDHERTHNEENKTFKCGICSRAFFQNGALKEHMKSHQQNPFKCSKCNMAFKSRYLQRTHTLLCEFIKEEQTNDTEEDSETEIAVFKAAIEQVGTHRMKKCSVIIRKDRHIEQAIKKNCKSILLPGLFARSYRLVK